MTRRRRAGALVVGALALGLLTLGAGTPVNAETAPSGSERTVTVEAGPFEGLAVTLSKTQNLRNEVIEVSWSGADETLFRGDSMTANYLQIMQCWGDAAAPDRQNCQFGAYAQVDTRGLGSTNSRALDNGTPVDPLEGGLPKPEGRNHVPFDGVGDEYVDGPRTDAVFDRESTNEVPYGRTGPDGTGTAFFEVQTASQARHLGCGKRVGDAVRDCWLVVVPRGETEVDGSTYTQNSLGGLVSSPLSRTNFQHAIPFRLGFEPIGVNCPIGAAERRLLGHEEIAEAIVRWQPVLCQATGAIFGFSQVGDFLARRQTVSPQPWLSIVQRPLPPLEVPADRRLVYAPLATSAIGIAVVIERNPKDPAEIPDDVEAGVLAKKGTRVLDVRLNARLLAKLLTQSYQTGVTRDVLDYATDHVSGNPASLDTDPEFQDLNPEFKNFQRVGSLGYLTNPQGLADANGALWAYIEGDPAARGFVAGKPDPYGMVVNKFYKGMSLTRDDFPRMDPTCTDFRELNPDHEFSIPRCAFDAQPYANDFHAAGRGASRGETLSRGRWGAASAGSLAGWKPSFPPPDGQRGVVAIVDTATAARFSLPLARLRNGAGEYVAPDLASMRAGLDAMEESDVAGVQELDPATKAKGAYPLTHVSYAVTAPNVLSPQEADDYAALLRFGALDGQTPGEGPGQLPRGYLPLTPAQRLQALDAASLIEDRVGPPPVPPAPEPTDEPTEPTDEATTPVAPGAEVPGEAPPAAEVPGATVPAVTDAPQGVTPVASASTPFSDVGPARFVVLLALVIALVAGGTRVLLPWLARRST
jgi:hypothetical protein